MHRPAEILAWAAESWRSSFGVAAGTNRTLYAGELLKVKWGRRYPYLVPLYACGSLLCFRFMETGTIRTL